MTFKEYTIKYLNSKSLSEYQIEQVLKNISNENMIELMNKQIDDYPEIVLHAFMLNINTITLE